jgi:hypothetical protein
MSSICDKCGKRFGGNIETHQAGNACKKKNVALVKVEAEKDNRRWRIVSTNAETVAGERIYALEAWFWDGCPVRATERWHVLESGSSPKALEEIAKEEGLLQSNKV